MAPGLRRAGTGRGERTACRHASGPRRAGRGASTSTARAAVSGGSRRSPEPVRETSRTPSPAQPSGGGTEQSGKDPPTPGILGGDAPLTTPHPRCPHSGISPGRDPGITDALDRSRRRPWADPRQHTAGAARPDPGHERGRDHDRRASRRHPHLPDPRQPADRGLRPVPEHGTPLRRVHCPRGEPQRDPARNGHRVPGNACRAAGIAERRKRPRHLPAGERQRGHQGHALRR